MNNNIYYNKYLKYKNKYLQLKYDGVGIDECGFGRIMQFAGYCWFTSVINGLILSSNLSKYLLNLMTTLTTTKNISDYKLFNYDECLQYPHEILFSLLYTIYISKQNLTELHGPITHKCSIISKFSEPMT